MFWPANHYVMILQNNYTKEITVHDLYNVSENKQFYKFDIDLDEYPYGEYNYVLFWCRLEYELELSNDPLKSTIKVLDEESGDWKEFHVTDLKPDTGIINVPNPENPRNVTTAVSQERPDEQFYSL